MMKKPIFVVMMLTVVAVAIVPALAQDGEFDVVPAPEPEAPCGWTSSTGAFDPSGHASGEIIVSYDSIEAMWASPQENVNHQFNRWDSYDTETGPVYYPIPIEL